MSSNVPASPRVARERGPWWDQGLQTPFEKHLADLLYAAMGSTLVALVVARELEPQAGTGQRRRLGKEGREAFWDLAFNDQVMMWCAIGAVGLMGLWLLLRRVKAANSRAAHTVLHLSLAALMMTSAFSYTYGTRGVARDGFPKLYESYHYLVGAKYYDELGYTGLYDCTVLADRETDRRFSQRWNTRRLTDYKMQRARHAMERAQADDGCRSHFTDKRWAEFKQDIRVYTTHYPYGVRLALKDHGYHGSPFHTFVAGSLANAVPINWHNLTLLTLIDLLAILAMMWALTRAFGWKAGFLFGIFFFTNFVDRWTDIGGSYFRYVWMASLGGGFAALKTRRWGLAGVLFVVSSALNVFPSFFTIFLGIAAAGRWFRERALGPQLRRLLFGTVGTAAVCLALGAAHGRGIDNYQGFFESMSMHTGGASSRGVGWQYAFMYRGRVEKKHKHYGYNKLKKERGRIKWFIRGTGLSALLIVGLIAFKNDDEIESAAMGGIAGIYFLFSTASYYYSFLALIMLMWHRREFDAGGRVMQVLGLGIIVATWWGWQFTHWYPFTINTVFSNLVGLYLLIAIVYLGVQNQLFTGVAWLISGDEPPPPATDQRARAQSSS